MQLYDVVKCPTCGEPSPILTRPVAHCVVCDAKLYDDRDRVERRYRVEITLVDWEDGTKAIAHVHYNGVLLRYFHVIDLGYPDHPEVELPKMILGGKERRPWFLLDANDVTDIIVSITDAYYDAIGVVQEVRPVTVE